LPVGNIGTCLVPHHPMIQCPPPVRTIDSDAPEA
jgi:hypothetical protein